MNVEKLTVELRKFASDREWDQFHSPKNLAIALSLEASELLEIFQWSRGQTGWQEVEDPAVKARVEHELADVLLYLIRFADLAGIDLETAALRKLAINHQKYPIALAKGSDKKYNELS